MALVAGTSLSVVRVVPELDAVIARRSCLGTISRDNGRSSVKSHSIVTPPRLLYSALISLRKIGIEKIA